jgi:light-regulated signal transduction histidine kinase (bacteriophytochrome)
MVASADSRLIQVLLRNLLGNAWKFTANQPNAEISFEAKESVGEVLYSIRDNGAGFDMAYANKLFQPFQRLHNVNEYPGNGVGLATVNRIVIRHGGRVFAHGLINHGATVYFTLGTSLDRNRSKNFKDLNGGT